jgi:hypothetical protein
MKSQQQQQVHQLEACQMERSNLKLLWYSLE